MADKPIPKHMQMLAWRVYGLRRHQRHSQASLAKEANTRPTTMSNIEQAKMTTITVEHLVALAQVLGTTPNYLLGMGPEDALTEAPTTPPKRHRSRTTAPVA